MGALNDNATGNDFARKQRIRTLVVDDDPLMRIAIRLLLERDRSIHVVGTAGDSHQGYLLANSLRPDLVLADFHMPGLDGLALTSLLSREFPDIRIIVVTSDSDPKLPGRCLAGGAHGFVTKDQLWHDLPSEIMRVFGAAGRTSEVPAGVA